jgi:hypothetical protein
MAKADTAVETEPGVVLDYLIVNTPLLNVEFVYAGKFGLAAAGYDPYDYWNPYSFEGYSVGWLSDLYWSDWNQSSVGLVVSNAPGVGLNSFCLDNYDQGMVGSAAMSTTQLGSISTMQDGQGRRRMKPLAPLKQKLRKCAPQASTQTGLMFHIRG